MSNRIRRLWLHLGSFFRAALSRARWRGAIDPPQWTKALGEPGTREGLLDQFATIQTQINEAGIAGRCLGVGLIVVYQRTDSPDGLAVLPSVAGARGISPVELSECMGQAYLRVAIEAKATAKRS